MGKRTEPGCKKGEMGPGVSPSSYPGEFVSVWHAGAVLRRVSWLRVRLRQQVSGNRPSVCKHACVEQEQESPADGPAL